jgi:Fe2+ transport system protein FeoA
MKMSLNNDSETLDALPEGAEAVVGAPTALSPTILRLMEMGLCAGQRVRMTRRAPLGDPLELSVRGTRLCLRRADARCFPAEVCTP